MRIRVEKFGRVFEPNVIQNHVIEASNRRILDYGLPIVRSLTPVRTGTARDGWYSDERTTIANDVPYVPYLEYGTRYMGATRMARQTAERMANQYRAEVSVRLQAL